MASSESTAQPAAADVFGALAHPVRRQLLVQLVAGEQTASELAEPYNITRSATSQHLKILMDAGLVERVRQGREQVYHLQPMQLTTVYTWIRQFEHFWTQSLDTLDSVLDDIAAEEARGDDT